MQQLRLWTTFASSGAIWSVSYLGVIEVLHRSLGATLALTLAWPIKIAWSTAHTAISHKRGTKAKLCAC